MSTLKGKQNIPSGWQNMLVDDVCFVMKGQGLSKSQIDSTGKNKCVLYGELFTTYDEVIKKVKSRTNSNEGVLSERGDILIPGSTTTVARDLAVASALNEEGVHLGGDINILRKKDDSYDSNFLAYYLTHYKKDELGKLGQGSTIVHLYGSNIRNLDITIPKDINEQQKIAEILGAVDEDIAKTQEVIEATEKLKRGLMQQLFTRGIGHTKFKETKIGEIPEEWRTVRVSDIVSKIIDNRGKTPPLDSVGIGMIEVNAIDKSQKYPNYSKISKYVSQETYNNWFRSGHPEKGDILIPTVGTVGVAVIMNENKGCIAQNIIAVRVKDMILSDFFYYLVVSPLFVDQIQKVLMGAVQPSLKVPHMLAFYIPLPTKPEQQEIAEILSAVDEKISVNKKLKEKLTLLKNGLMQDLLSGRVRTIIN